MDPWRLQKPMIDDDPWQPVAMVDRRRQAVAAAMVMAMAAEMKDKGS